MSKRDNHWYLVEVAINSLRRAFGGRWKIVVPIWIGLVLIFFAIFQAGGVAPDVFGRLLGLLVAVVATVPLTRAFWIRANVRKAYAQALRADGPDQLVAVVARAMRTARSLPDLAAFSAQATALAYALYGREDEAFRSLSAVEWKGRAPLIQAVGLSAEGLVELLCRRNVSRALELTRRARALASLSAAVPGAAATERYHGTLVGLAEAMQGTASAMSVRAMEESAADQRQPALRALGSLGLAVISEQSGDTERARSLRARLAEDAPHCAPLHLDAAAFAGPSAPAAPGPVSVSLAAPENGAAPRPTPAEASKQLVMKMILLWAVLAAVFGALWLFLDSGGRSPKNQNDPPTTPAAPP
jgi:hypothetical protein